MQKNRYVIYLVVVLGALAALISATTPALISKIRFGLEFKGGYEIYYVAAPLNGNSKVSREEMLATVDVLRKRADSIGMAEPEIRLEGENHIRLRLAGMTSSDESRSRLGNPVGLPTRLTEKYTQTVGSVLGNTALRDTMFAGWLGICCIFLLLVVLYRGLGFLAIFSTLVYLWLLLIVFISFHATLSLSAVVAFVLGIGMAADASIICFERIRENLGRGEEKNEAVQLGFKESLLTIVDANLVTALAMIALFIAGIGPIQGFSLTMLASIVISFSTNFFFLQFASNLLVKAELLPTDLLVGSAKVAAKNTTRSRLMNFVKMGRTVACISILTIAAGVLYYRAHGLNLDIDFTSGTALDIDLSKAVSQDDATSIMAKAGAVPATVSIGGKDNEHIAARFDEVLKPEQLKSIINAFKERYERVEYEENTADPGVARDFALKAIYAVLAAFVGIGLYIWFRFSWTVAIAILVGIVHDLLLVSAIFSLFKQEIDVTYIAALLTIMGYSLNDKIVIFGRIRENQKSEERILSVSRLINFSIWQTLGRSVYTVLTVVLASACLYFFACEPLQMFSLAILLGLLSGAYSSIFLSSLVWFLFQERKGDEMEHDRTGFSRTFYLAVSGAFAALFVSAWITVPALMGPIETALARVPTKDKAQSGPLGDLTPYETIAKDTLKLVEAGDFPAAKSRITELESAWDKAEEKMQPMSPSSWTSVDKSIDRALSQVRSGKPDKEAAISALRTLLDKFKTMISK